MLSHTFSRSNPLISFRAPDNTPHVSAQPSILAEYVLFPFYDMVVQHIPVGVHPNAITLFGIFCTFTSSCLMLSSMASGTLFEPPYAAWLPTHTPKPEDNPIGPLYPPKMDPILLTPVALLLLCGVLNLCYCVADNTDGRVARRDKASSVIGEYLDHSLDCVTSLLSTAVVFCTMGASTANMATTVSSIAVVTMVAHTLHYEENYFVWGNRFMSVDEAMLFFSLGILIPVGIPGIAFIRIPLPQCFLNMVPWFIGFRVIDAMYFVSLFSQIFTLAGLTYKNFRLMFRFQTIYIVIVAAVLLQWIPEHNAAAAELAKVGPVPFTLFGSYSVGRLAFPAVWALTAAFSFSTLIHMPIVAHCAKREHMDYIAAAAVTVTLLMYMSSPVAALLWSMVVHFIQIGFNIRLLYVAHWEAQVKKRREAEGGERE